MTDEGAASGKGRGRGRLFGRRGRDRDAHDSEERLAEERAREAEQLSRPLWTDSHCHLQYVTDDADEAATVERAVAAGVRRMVCAGTDAASSRRAMEVAKRRSKAGELSVEVYATVGLHPHDASQGVDEVSALVGELDGEGQRSARVVAVGECGLDYHYDYSPRSDQRLAFAAQVSLANEHRLALVIHTRNAFDDTLAILQSEGVPDRTVFHCFTGGPADAERCLALGAYLSFSGIATFSNANEIREAVGLCPEDRLLIETDSPYLTPVPHRGRPNEPSYVPFVGAALAETRGVEPAELASLTTANAARAFGLAES